MNITLINLAYLVAAILFILGLRMLSSPRSAPRGNLTAAVGMFIAVVATLLDAEVIDFRWIAAGAAVGGAAGAFVALRVAMTAMPQMVALLNGLGGAASALVAGADLIAKVDQGVTPTGIVPIAIVLSVLIGSVTLTGSLIAFAKLQEVMTTAPLTYPGQQVVNALIGLGVVALGVMVAMDPTALTFFWALMGISLLLGVLLVIPIGGADMPVVISLLNSYSGMAASTGLADLTPVYSSLPPPPVASSPNVAKRTLASERFIALHMMRVRMRPDAPTSEPAMISRLFSRTNPVAHAATPE